MTMPIFKCAGCGYIFVKDYGYNYHKCKTVVKQNTDKLTELVGEK